MGARTSSRLELRVSHVDGWLCITVPYERAEHWQRYFNAHGIGSTLIRDPHTHEASLDLWKQFCTSTAREPARGSNAGVALWSGFQERRFS
jgi:hypothetical protein